MGLGTRQAPSWMNFWENMLGPGLPEFTPPIFAGIGHS